VIDVRSATPVVAALALASLGHPVFPAHSMRDGRCSCDRSNCTSPGKHPRTPHGKDDATTSFVAINDWWGRWPEANVALRTSAFFVLDIDPDDGGASSLAELERTHGVLPRTIEALTGGGGRHLGFAHPGFRIPNSASKIAPGLDVRGGDGYIIVAPSNHESGGVYRWADGCAPGDVEPAQAPQWLIEAILHATPASEPTRARRAAREGVVRKCTSSYCRDALVRAAASYVAKAKGVEDGRKNVAFNLASHLASFLDQHGCRLSEADAFEILDQWNRRCACPLADRELRYRIANGFRYGDRQDKLVQALELVEPPPPPTPSAPVATTCEEARAQVALAVRDFRPGEGSTHLQAVAGAGKTTAAMRRAMQAMRSRSPGWARCTVLVEPTVDLVEEKAREAREHALELGVELEVRVLRGKSADSASGWWCEHLVDASERAKLQRSSCIGCPLYGRGNGAKWVAGACMTTPGRFRYAREETLDRLGRRRDSTEEEFPVPVLLICTLDALRHAWGAIPRRATIIIDDAPLLGLLNKVDLHANDIRSEIERAQEWRSHTVTPQLVPDRRVPEVIVCDVVVGLLQAMIRGVGSEAPQRVEAYVRSLPPDLFQALRDGGFARPSRPNGLPLPWPWEEFELDAEPDGVPAFSDVAIRLAERVAATGVCPHIERVRRSWVVHSPDAQLLDRIGKGRVLWLAVEAVPTWLVERLGIETVVLRAAPEQLRALVAERRSESSGAKGVLSWGAGLRRGDQKQLGTPTDRLIRSLAQEFKERCVAGSLWFEGAQVGTFAAVLHKSDRDALERDLGPAAWCVHYGSGHAGTNALSGAELLIVRRYALNPAAARTQACALRRMFPVNGVVEQATPGSLWEARRWTPGGEVIPTRVPADVLEQQLTRSAESAFMTNAVGRGRPLSATSRRIVIILNGRPFDLGGAVPEVWPFDQLLSAFGVEATLEPTSRDQFAALARLNAQRAAQHKAQRERVRNILIQEPSASTHTIERRCGVGVRNAQRLVAAVRAADAPGVIRFAFATLRARVITSDARTHIDSLCIRLSEVSTRFGLEPLQQALAEVGAPSLGRITIRRRRQEIVQALMDGSELVLPSRSDRAASLDWVLRAMVRVAEAPDLGPSTAGETRQFPLPPESSGVVG
jgi:hypothetical protein